MRGSRSALPRRRPLRIAAPPGVGYAGSMNRHFQALPLLAIGLGGCGTPPPADSAGDSAVDSGTDSGDTAAACNPPADGVVPAGSWKNEEYHAFTIAEDSSVFFYACVDLASAETATVTAGAVDWPLSWRINTSPDTADNHWEGRATGTFCADTASLTWAPLETAPTTYRRVSPDEMPDMCD